MLSIRQAQRGENKTRTTPTLPPSGHETGHHQNRRDIDFSYQNHGFNSRVLSWHHLHSPELAGEIQQDAGLPTLLSKKLSDNCSGCLSGIQRETNALLVLFRPDPSGEI